jgi:hypothetical protein
MLGTLQLYYQGVTALQPYVAKAEAFMCFNMPNNTRTIVNYTPGKVTPQHSSPFSASEERE